MVKINYTELAFDHAVIFELDNTVFACAKQDNGHTRLFLVFDRGLGRVYTRNGKADSWELLEDTDAVNIRNRVAECWSAIPVYRINGSHNN